MHWTLYAEFTDQTRFTMAPIFDTPCGVSVLSSFHSVQGLLPPPPVSSLRAFTQSLAGDGLAQSSLFRLLKALRVIRRRCKIRISADYAYRLCSLVNRDAICHLLVVVGSDDSVTDEEEEEDEEAM